MAAGSSDTPWRGSVPAARGGPESEEASGSQSEASSEPRLLSCMSRPGSGPGPQFLQIWSKNFRAKKRRKLPTTAVDAPTAV
eukprot:11764838-Prorocentrum_lima.AAC.1